MRNKNSGQMPNAVLFDLDGTLMDTAPDLGAALNHVLQSLGLEITAYEDYRVVSSNGALGMLEMGLGKKINNYDIEVLRAQFLKFYESHICRGTVFFPGIVEFLQQLNSRDIPWGIVTNKPGYLTKKLCENFAEFAQCKVCYSGDTFSHRKPHPEPLLKAAEALAVSAEQIWYVGDAPRDMEAATSANMIRVLARYGYLTKQELAMDWDVDIEVESATELSEKFLGLISVGSEVHGCN